MVAYVLITKMSEPRDVILANQLLYRGSFFTSLRQMSKISE